MSHYDDKLSAFYDGKTSGELGATNFMFGHYPTVNAAPLVDVEEIFGDGPYDSLEYVLDKVYEQVAFGKGKERHANSLGWEDQPIFEIGRETGGGFNYGQALKKTRESLGMFRRGETTAAKNEILGAIAYLASTYLLIEEAEHERDIGDNSMGSSRCSEDVCGC